MTNSIQEIRDADCILITGSNTAESHPVIGYEVIRAAKRGAHILIIDPRRIPLTDHATLFLQVHPGTDIYVYLAMMHSIINEGWADEAFISERTEGYEEFRNILEEYTVERASLISGVSGELILEAARVYAWGLRANGISKFSDGHGHSSILYAMGITQRSNGTELVMTLANMAMLCGQIGKPSTGVNPLRGQSNVQGACDVGCLVDVFPGYVKVTDEEKRNELAQKWGVERLPDKVGLTIVEAMQAAKEGRVKAVYIMGENPMMSDPNTTHVEEGLRNLDFLVVQDIFPSETAMLAHVILPASSSLEKDGTFTNTERRVQQLHPVIESPGDALPDWKIITEIAKVYDQKMRQNRDSGYWNFDSSSAVFDELAGVTKIYAGISHRRLGNYGLQWPCPDNDHPGTPILHSKQFSRGKGRFTAILAKDPVELPDDEFPFFLSTGRVLYHYHSGTMTRRSEPLDWKEPRGFVEINSIDAAALKIKNNTEIIIRSRRGAIQATARISDRVPVGTIFLAFHWKEFPANILTHDFGLDPIAKIPAYKISAVRLEKPKISPIME